MPLKVFKRNNLYSYRGTVAGRRLRGTTGATDKRIAERIAAEIEAKAWQSHLDGPGATLTARKLYPGTANATMNRQGIVPAQAIINYAAELEWCAPIRVKRFKVNAKRKTPVTWRWVDAFATQAVQDDLRHLAALCLFMFGTGARRGEACALMWRDVELFQKKAIINQTKIDDQRVAHLSPPVVAALANIPSNRNPDSLVFQYASGESVGQVWNNVIERAGIEKLSPHCCRHGFATSMLQAGIDPKTVAVRGGWKDVATVMKFYAHAMDDPTVTDVLFGTK